MDRFGDPMSGMLQPSHLIFLFLILTILFGPGKLPTPGKGLARGISNLRGLPSSFSNALFMAKGVDPRVGRDVGDMIPDENLKRDETLYLCLLALLMGNTIYFLAMPLLPDAARMGLNLNPTLPTLVDIWICLLTFGLLNLLHLLRKQNKPKE
jgi:hypothetical protein